MHLIVVDDAAASPKRNLGLGLGFCLKLFCNGNRRGGRVGLLLAGELVEPLLEHVGDPTIGDLFLEAENARHLGQLRRSEHLAGACVQRRLPLDPRVPVDLVNHLDVVCDILLVRLLGNPHTQLHKPVLILEINARLDSRLPQADLHAEVVGIHAVLHLPCEEHRKLPQVLIAVGAGPLVDEVDHRAPSNLRLVLRLLGEHGLGLHGRLDDLPAASLGQGRVGSKPIQPVRDLEDLPEALGRRKLVLPVVGVVERDVVHRFQHCQADAVRPGVLGPDVDGRSLQQRVGSRGCLLDNRWARRLVHPLDVHLRPEKGLPLADHLRDVVKLPCFPNRSPGH
mmetsp:Transcript_19324/g.47420  ORF Transcript_19324/g.47420 Transcript_19324/m.47420 type:complete len:338 (-) Transcript_19324:1343-2356(-)